MRTEDFGRLAERVNFSLVIGITFVFMSAISNNFKQASYQVAGSELII